MKTQNLKDSFYSQKKVNLETENTIIKLGDKLVKQFKANSKEDIISNWIAYYIAELIIKIKNTEQNDKLKIQCFNAILKLWHHRTEFPNDKYPFKNFENIIETLNKIDTNNTNPYYLNTNLATLDHFEFVNKDEQEWLKLVEQIDIVARASIKYIIKKVAEKTTSDEIKDWIDIAYPTNDIQDISLIMKLLPIITIEGKDEELKIKEIECKSLNEDIINFNNFIRISKLLIKELEKDLVKLKAQS